MDEEIKKRLLDWVTSIEGAAPETVRQFLAYERLEATLALLACVAGVILASVVIYKAVKKNSDDAFPVFFAAAVAGIVCTIFTPVNASRLIKVTVAPRVVVLDYVKDCIKK